MSEDMGDRMAVLVAALRKMNTEAVANLFGGRGREENRQPEKGNASAGLSVSKHPSEAV